MINENDTKRIPYGEIAQVLNDGMAGADPERAERLDRLQTVRNAKTAGMERERARLGRKLGAEHPRVVELARKIQVNKGLVMDLSAEAARVKETAPLADADTWVLYGHVRNKKLQGLPNLTVALYDGQGRWIEAVGFACTDANGYYLIRYRPGNEKTDPATGTGEKSSREAQGFIHVLDAKRVLLYADKEPIVFQPGHVDQREIVLDGDAGTCVSPEPATQPGPGPQSGTGSGLKPATGSEKSFQPGPTMGRKKRGSAK